MTQPLNLLVVTMTGTAEMVAEDLAAHVGGRLDVKVRLAEDADASIFEAGAPLIVVSSTYGKGEIPDPGKPLYDELLARAGGLETLRYGVVSLGDSIYRETFANGGRLWDEALQARGAASLRQTLQLDASGPQDLSACAIAWLDGWLSAYEAQGQPSETCA